MFFRRFFLIAFLSTTAIADDGVLRFAELGDLRLQSGHTIRDCRLGYRTWGVPNADRSNAVLITTWFGGTTEDLSSLIGAGRMLDPSQYFVVAVDALGNGVSSSPSNSTAQPDEKFPRFTIGDMVRSQHELITRELKLDKVFLVTGASMGGMQTYEWVVSYPDFMTRAIPIVGTPKQTSHDLLLWKTELDLVEELGARSMKHMAAINSLELWTPEYIVAKTAPEAVDEWMRSRAKALEKLDHLDYAAQLRAMIDHDIFRGRPAAEVVAQIKTRMLVVVAAQDQTVNATPARELARLTRSEVLTLSGKCGHLASACESELMNREIWRFLASP
jgi:homoserine acetyltransferase